jgi:hypothetical protein
MDIRIGSFCFLQPSRLFHSFFAQLAKQRFDQASNIDYGRVGRLFCTNAKEKHNGNYLRSLAIVAAATVCLEHAKYLSILTE